MIYYFRYMNSVKEKLHSIIDHFKDEELLAAVYEILQEKERQQPGELWKELTIAQKEEVLNAARETTKTEKQISHDHMVQKNSRWLEK